MNEMLAAQGVRFRSGKRRSSQYSVMKAKWEEVIKYEVLMQKIRVVTRYPVMCCFRYYVRDRRTDPDNISSGARKIVLDGLVGAGILEGDGWTYLMGDGGKWEEYFEVCRENPRVSVTLVER